MVLPSQVARYEYYYEQMKESLNHCLKYSNKFDKFIMENQNYKDFNLDFNDMTFLNEHGQVFNETVSFKHLVKLLVSYSDSILP